MSRLRLKLLALATLFSPALAAYHVYFVADNQVEMLGQNTDFFDELATYTQDLVSYLLLPEQVHYDIDYKAWRRVATCWSAGCDLDGSCCTTTSMGTRYCGDNVGETQTCTTAVDAIRDWCSTTSNPPFAVVALVGVNDQKSYTWKGGDLPVRSYYDALLEASETACRSSWRTLIVDPLPLQPGEESEPGRPWGDVGEDPWPGRVGAFGQAIDDAVGEFNSKFNERRSERLFSPAVVDPDENYDGVHYSGPRSSRMLAWAIATQVAQTLCESALVGVLGPYRAGEYCRIAAGDTATHMPQLPDPPTPSPPVPTPRPAPRSTTSRPEKNDNLCLCDVYNMSADNDSLDEDVSFPAGHDSGGAIVAEGKADNGFQSRLRMSTAPPGLDDDSVSFRIAPGDAARLGGVSLPNGSTGAPLNGTSLVANSTLDGTSSLNSQADDDVVTTPDTALEGAISTTSVSVPSTSSSVLDGASGQLPAAANNTSNSSGSKEATWEDLNTANAHCNGTRQKTDSVKTTIEQTESVCATRGDAKLVVVVLATVVPFLIFESGMLTMLFMYTPQKKRPAAEPGEERPRDPGTSIPGDSGRWRATRTSSVSSVSDVEHGPPACVDGNANATASGAAPVVNTVESNVTARSDRADRPEPRTSKRVLIRLRALDGLRSLAAMHIAIFTLYQTIHVGAEKTAYTCSFCGFGKYWMQVFFLISGFALAAPIEERDAAYSWVPFMIRRLAPIYPLYCLSLVLSFPFVQSALCDGLRGTIFRNGECDKSDASWLADFTSVGTLASFTMVQSWFKPFQSHINGPAWFVSTLLAFYLVFPHWHRAAAKMSNQMKVIALVIAYCSSFTPHMVCYQIFDIPLWKRWYGEAIHNYIEFNPLCNWSPFAVGILFAALGNSLRRNWDKFFAGLPLIARIVIGMQEHGATFALLAIFVFFVTAEAPGFEMGRYALMIDKGPWALPIVLVLIGSCTATNPKWYSFGLNLLGLFAPLSEYSWPLYILHIPVAAIIPHVASPFITLWIRPVVIAVIAIGLYIAFKIPSRRITLALLSLYKHFRKATTK